MSAALELGGEEDIGDLGSKTGTGYKRTHAENVGIVVEIEKL